MSEALIEAGDAVVAAYATGASLLVDKALEGWETAVEEAGGRIAPEAEADLAFAAEVEVDGETLVVEVPPAEADAELSELEGTLADGLDDELGLEEG